MKAQITGILINVDKEIVETVTIPRELKAYYKILNCSTIDIVSRKIGKRVYDIICDDEGIWNNPKISAIDDFGNAMLVGNLFIVKFDGMENETSLDSDDIKYIMKYIMKQGTRNYPKAYPMLHQCGY